MEDLIGKKFGRLIVLNCYMRNYKRYCLCLCDCGKKKEIRADNIKKGLTKSCGCLSKELLKKRQTTHGASTTRLYKIWDGMKKRCRPNSKNKYYYGKGIKVCESWKDFNNFKEWSINNGYKENLTIDRIDVNGDYCPENCRWATYKQQARNTSFNRMIEYNGQRMCASEVAEILNIKQSTFLGRLERNKEYLFYKYNKSKKYITYNGKTLPISEWVRELGINNSSFYYHIRRGKSAEDTINHFILKLMRAGRL